MTPDSLIAASLHAEAGNFMGNICLFLFFIAVAGSLYFWFTEKPKAVDSKLWKGIRKGRV